MEKVGPQQNIQCPSCLRVIPCIAVGGVNAFPPNHHLQFEVEVAGYISKFASGYAVLCTFCADGCSNHADVFCSSCHMFLCKTAQECHRHDPKLFLHEVIALGKETAILLPTILKPADQYCSQPKHNTKELHLYCNTCSRVICNKCASQQHRTHKITPSLSIVAGCHRDKMKESLLCVQQFIPTLAEAIDANQKIMHQVETSKQLAEVAIEDTFKKMVEILDERKKALLSELETIALSKTTSLTLQREQFERMQQHIDHCTKITSYILQTHTDHEVVVLGGLVPTELNFILEKMKCVTLTPNQQCFFKLSVQPDPLLKEISQVGNIVELSPDATNSKCTFPTNSLAVVKKKYFAKVDTMSSNGEGYPCGGLQVKAELRPKLHDGAVVPEEVEDHGDGTYTITLTPQTAGPHQLLITMDGHHIHGSPFDLSVKADYTSICGPHQMIEVSGKPYCLAIHRNGDIYVGCEDNHIYVFNHGGHLKKTIGNSGNGDGEFYGPVGLSIKGEVMYVADHYNNRIQKMTTEGEFLDTFGNKFPGEGQLYGPWDVIVDAKDRVIVSDSNNNKVQVFNKDGGFLLSIHGEEVRSPRCLALDSQENIHVTLYTSNTINVFTPEGAYIRMYGDLKGPRGIAVNKEGYSFVCERVGNCVSIFDPLGCKIHTVTNLNGPNGIALLVDSNEHNLYIANFENGNVLKYIF